MARILSVSQIRESEQYTMQCEPISSYHLMQRAGTTFAQQLMTDFNLQEFQRVVIFCGYGNNGGDGFVVARELLEHSFRVVVVLPVCEGTFTPDALAHFEHFRTMQQQSPLAACVDFETFSSQYTPAERSLFVDALFGIGLSRPLTGHYAQMVTRINEMHQPTVALDMPSGLFADHHKPAASEVVRASITYTFQWYKWALLLPENSDRVGAVKVLDIGLQMPNPIVVHDQTIDERLIASLYLPPARYAHKGTNGHGLLFAGSATMPGAATLAAMAAMRSGLGKLTVHAPHGVLDRLLARLPEALLSPDLHESVISHCYGHRLTSLQAIAVGPGIGCAMETVAFLESLITEAPAPLIIDADALNILAENPAWLEHLPPYTILTPHFKEFERLAGVSANDFDRIARLRAFASRYQVVLLLKGHHSVVALPDGQLWVNTTGNAGMATAGSGDVLTGMLLGCVAKGYHPVCATLLAVYLHGLSGDIALGTESMESLIASDIIASIGKAFKQIQRYDTENNVETTPCSKS